MKYLKRFNENNSDIEMICNQYGIENYTINPDGTVDVDGDVGFHGGKNLTKLPLRFGKVTGDFYCHNNKLTSLEGAPQNVGGDFYCNDNKLTNLEGGPVEVGGDFYCQYNQLISLEGAPREVGGNFDCNSNQLTNLIGGPNEVVGGFGCSSNRLTSLKGCPQKVGGGFNCSNNELRTLEGVPQKISGYFYCLGNPIYIIYELFKYKFREFLDKINFIYTDLFNGPDMIRGDVLEQIAEELEVKLPTNWVEKVGEKYIII